MNFGKIKLVFGNLLIFLLAGLIVNYYLEANLLDFGGVVLPSIIYSILLGGLIWMGSIQVRKIVDKNVSWEQYPRLNFTLLLVLLLIYSVLAYFLVEFVWNILYHEKSVLEFVLPSGRNILMIMGITLLIVLFYSSKRFLKDKRDDLLKEEKLKTEIIRLEYETLKNQVNPHFLFNSLNALTGLVSENDDAVLFIKKLSDVYRYVLEQKDKEIVSLEKELEFVEAYAYLHEIRFGDSFNLIIQEIPKGQNVIPLSLQMLVENAIKHNIISEDEPLTISIFKEEDYLIVENNLQLKSMVKDSNKIGLENIKLRYSFLTEKEFILDSDNEIFTVKVPLLNVTN